MILCLICKVRQAVPLTIICDNYECLQELRRLQASGKFRQVFGN